MSRRTVRRGEMSTPNADDTRPRRTTMLTAALVLAVAAVLAGFYGVSWAVTAHGDSLSYATQRDEALRVGQQGVINFTTADSRKAQSILDIWERTSTGALHDEVVRDRKTYSDAMTASKSVRTPEVLGAAMTELDDRAGKARMIVVAKLILTPDGQQPTEDRGRYQVELTREAGQWKLSALSPVPVG
jgi:Mce-associated membrane protein